MIRSMYSGISGMVNHQTRMDVVSNNIANVNTTGFKAGRASFKDALYMAVDASGEEKGSFQVGTGIGVSGISNDFSQGDLEPTGRTFDLAISGRGFFGVVGDDESGDGQVKYTRDGTFSLDSEGFLVNSMGMRVVGVDNEDGIEIDTEYQDDIQIDENGTIFQFERDDDGNITSDPEEMGQVALFDFQNASGLTKAGNNLFLENNTTGERFTTEDDSDRFGTINSGYIEMANINLAKELTNLITTHRGYQANTKVFSTADDVLREIIELKR
ncbi:MAG: flagellar hook-basal body protein [Firmicutes bacterium]|nr:flagellar hook-basal body protein [Bacillota bacterium]